MDHKNVNDCPRPPAPSTKKGHLVWGNKLEFIMASLSAAIGLGNLWRFPYQCYKNGGGAFLVPFLMMTLLVGFPQVVADLALGQYGRSGAVRCWRAAPAMEGVGWTLMAVSLQVDVYYTVVVSYAAFYMFASFRRVLPWITCDNWWNTPRCQDGQGSEAGANCTSAEGVLSSSSCASLLNGSVGMLGNDTALLNDTAHALRPVSASDEYFHHYVLELSSGISDLGTLRWPIVLCYLLSLLVVFVTLCLGIRTWGKMAYLFALIPYAVLIALLVQALLQEGAVQGIVYLLRPRWSELADARVWVDAVGQAYFTLGCAGGSLITIGSHNNFRNNVLNHPRQCPPTKRPNPHRYSQQSEPFGVSARGLSQPKFGQQRRLHDVIMTPVSYFWSPQVFPERPVTPLFADAARDAVIITIGDTLTSLLCGVVVFSILGSIAYQLNVPVEEAVGHGAGLAFVTYPNMLARMPGAPVWSIFFMFMMFNLGIGSSVSNVAMGHTVILEALPVRVTSRPRAPLLLLFAYLCLFFLVGIVYTAQGGMYVLQMMDANVTYTLLIVGFFKAIGVAWVYGVNRMSDDLQAMGGWRPWRVCRWSYKYVTPALIIFVTVFYLTDVKYVKYGDYVLPIWSQAIGWVLALITLLIVPATALYRLLTVNTHATFRKRLEIMRRPTDDWGPVDSAMREEDLPLQLGL